MFFILGKLRNYYFVAKPTSINALGSKITVVLGKPHSILYRFSEITNILGFMIAA
jgi:hypothetical protein